MATTTYNVFPDFADVFTSGLDSIAAATPSTVDDLCDQIYTYVQGVYYSGGVDSVTELELRSVTFNIINGYFNKALSNSNLYSANQGNFIQMMLGSDTISACPTDSLDSWLTDIQENLANSGLTMEHQTPLMLAILAGSAANTYWVGEIAGGGGSAWASYFATQEYRNYLNLRYWVAAAMEGALLGANTGKNGLIAPNTDIQSANIISAMIGALAVGAGKVIFKWIPEIQPNDVIENSVQIPISDNDSVSVSGFGGSGGPGPKYGIKSYYTDGAGYPRTDIQIGSFVIKFFPNRNL